MPTIMHMDSPLGPARLERSGDAWIGEIQARPRLPETETLWYFRMMVES
jgi:hypothetical protein